MKILINRRIVEGPWGGGNKFTKALKKFAIKKGHIVTERLEDDIDIIHMQDVHADELGIDANVAINYKNQYNPKVKIVHRVNDMDLGRKNNFVIFNGVDKSIFKPREKINNEKINIVTHHWSNNKGKGFDIYEAIDRFVKENSKYTFTYIGRERGTFKNSKVIKPLHGLEMGLELSKYDVYVSASEYENCPNHILESIACNIPTYAISKGGASLGLVGNDYVFNDWAELKKILLSNSFIKNGTNIMTWEQCIDKYIEVYQKILAK
jgi:glycosyltransferase involved in cell wall biosynthesis